MTVVVGPFETVGARTSRGAPTGLADIDGTLVTTSERYKSVLDNMMGDWYVL